MRSAPPPPIATTMPLAKNKYNLYQRIADIAGMQIVEQFKRTVLNRTERAKNAYSETMSMVDVTDGYGMKEAW